ncbi:conserved Plasmodium membrane protein, unknown function [Plasmodium malariae]|uniref:Uncharacterized protein n=1 Tax=Plasmodium malariae TaxID=5858 RepID=A0A1D3RIS9_PLAMA|nr:conserved Plasmodium membrane protein, unknown function [Plasmodium malariae]SCN44988.1 conserved Plasmodium membrane protein, unknown function [Plasmodium malariae]
MEDHKTTELFKKKNNTGGRNRERCSLCKTGYQKFINTFITWEVVLLLTHVLIFLIIIYKYTKDSKLDSKKKNLFRSYESTGHFIQGFTFVLLLVPFQFTKIITIWLINCSIQKDMHEQEIQRYYDDIEGNKRDKNIEERDKDMYITSHELGKQSIGNGGRSCIDVNNMEDSCIENSSNTNNSETEKKVKCTNCNEIGGNNNNNHNNYSNNKNNPRTHQIVNTIKGQTVQNSASELFVRRIVFPVNTPKYKKKEIQYFFLCAKLYSLKRCNFLFVIKYVCSFILMFAYPLYNLIKRKLIYKYFYYSSYFMNAFDFASGMLTGAFLVLIYGLILFLVSFYKNRKNEKFYFYDNYAFINDVNCLCDEHIRINIKNNPYLKNMVINYFNIYYNYKILLFMGILMLTTICVFSFIFSFTSLAAYELHSR